MHAGLQVRRDAEAILEADDRAVVEAEQIRRQLTQVAAPQVAREAVREPEVAVVPLDRQRRRQVDQASGPFAPATGEVPAGGWVRAPRGALRVGGRGAGQDDGGDEEDGKGAGSRGAQVHGRAGQGNLRALPRRGNTRRETGLSAHCAIRRAFRFSKGLRVV